MDKKAWGGDQVGMGLFSGKYYSKIGLAFL